jgi:hypothetical protein
MNTDEQFCFIRVHLRSSAANGLPPCFETL